jgi:hypothetical protein
MVLHSFNKQSPFEGFINLIIATAIFHGHAQGDPLRVHDAGTLPWLQPGEATCELAPADFSAFGHRDCVDDKKPLRHLPTAQFASAKFQ